MYYYKDKRPCKNQVVINFKLGVVSRSVGKQARALDVGPLATDLDRSE